MTAIVKVRPLAAKAIVKVAVSRLAPVVAKTEFVLPDGIVR